MRVYIATMKMASVCQHGVGPVSALPSCEDGLSSPTRGGTCIGPPSLRRLPESRLRMWFCVLSCIVHQVMHSLCVCFCRLIPGESSADCLRESGGPDSMRMPPWGVLDLLRESFGC